MRGQDSFRLRDRRSDHDQVCATAGHQAKGFRQCSSMMPSSLRAPASVARRAAEADDALPHRAGLVSRPGAKRSADQADAKDGDLVEHGTMPIYASDLFASAAE